MLKLYLVRHGWTAWHSEGRICGWLDVPLDEQGQAQAEAAGRWLATHCRDQRPLLIASPVLRAAQTAQAIVAAFDPPLALQTEPRLGELRSPQWQGRLADDIVSSEPKWNDFHKGPADFRMPGGESGREAQTRVVAAVEDLRTRHPRGQAILVSHADPLRGLLAYYLGLEANLYYRLRIDCGSVSRLSLPHQPDLTRPVPKARLDFLNLTEGGMQN